VIKLCFFFAFVRFGLSTNTTTIVDEEARKKARLERFSQAPKINASEEEKKKARAIRSFCNLFIILVLKKRCCLQLFADMYVLMVLKFSGLLRVLLVHHSQVPRIALIL
jgi:hypothetical protein